MATCRAMTTHLDHARRELIAALGESDHLDDLPSDEANTYEARRMRARAGMAVKAAEVHALLAIAEVLTDLRDDQAMSAVVQQEALVDRLEDELVAYDEAGHMFGTSGAGAQFLASCLVEKGWVLR